MVDPEHDPVGDAARERCRPFIDWLFHNRQTGRTTVAQFPNVASWIFLASVPLRWAVPSDDWARTAVDGIGVAALAWWAIDEVLRGVNPWRRLLGVGGCVFVIAGVASLRG